MISPNVLDMAVARIGLMPFFPQSDAARAVVALELAAMCGSDDQVNWLATRFTTLFKRWPGLAELRAVLCSKFRPLDGVEANSVAFPDGCPSEKPPVIPDYRQISADPKIESFMRKLAGAKRLPG